MLIQLGWHSLEQRRNDCAFTYLLHIEYRASPLGNNHNVNCLTLWPAFCKGRAYLGPADPWLIYGNSKFGVLMRNYLSTAPFFQTCPGWSGVAKVSCILRHQGVQMILAYSWARPAILVAGRVLGNVFIMPPPFSMGVYYHRCPYVRPSCPVHPVHNTFGFRAISFERIGILDWNFVHRYIIIKCRSSVI